MKLQISEVSRKKNPLKMAKSLSFTDIGTPWPCREFLMPQICLLMLLAKMKFSRKYLDLQYAIPIR